MVESSLPGEILNVHSLSIFVFIAPLCLFSRLLTSSRPMEIWDHRKLLPTTACNHPQSDHSAGRHHRCQMKVRGLSKCNNLHMTSASTIRLPPEQAVRLVWACLLLLPQAALLITKVCPSPNSLLPPCFTLIFSPLPINKHRHT